MVWVWLLFPAWLNNLEESADAPLIAWSFACSCWRGKAQSTQGSTMWPPLSKTLIGSFLILWTPPTLWTKRPHMTSNWGKHDAPSLSIPTNLCDGCPFLFWLQPKNSSFWMVGRFGLGKMIAMKNHIVLVADGCVPTLVVALGGLFAWRAMHSVLDKE